jgi:hypothetical protein
MTQSYAIDGHSQPNYLQLFAGSNQGVTDNSTPHGFSTPNLRSALAAAGYSFTGYSESMPYAGYTGDSYTSVAGQAQYVRKHNPWINWIGAPANAVPTSEALPFTAFPTDYSTLPDFSIVIPNEQHNMHDGGRSAGDAWLQANLSGYIAWAQTHNSLFVLTFDEDDGSHAGHITTIFVGPMVIAGQYSQTIDHLNVLRTLTDLYGLAPLGDAAGVAPIAGIFAVPEPATALLLLPGLAWLGAGWPGQRRSAPNGAA